MTTYVCAERDIECGTNERTWCERCPKRNRSVYLTPEEQRILKRALLRGALPDVDEEKPPA